MKRNNKKGFTIVELVIVIAVIAILSAVLIPTFSGIITSANESRALQEAQNAYKNALITELADGDLDDGTSAEINGYKFTWASGKLSKVEDVNTANGTYEFTIDANGTITKATTNQ